MRTGTAVTALVIAAVIALAGLVHSSLWASGERSHVLYAPGIMSNGGCTTVVGPNQKIQAAIDAVPRNNRGEYTICVKGGTYAEVVKISAEKTNITLRPLSPNDRPILDGNKRLPGGSGVNAPLLDIEGNNTRVEGFEIRFSTGRGVAVSPPENVKIDVANVVLRDLDIHDNWGLGLIVDGREDGKQIYRSRNVLVENTRVYNNILKAKRSDGVYRGRLVSTPDAPQWAFNLDELWGADTRTGPEPLSPFAALPDRPLAVGADGRTGRLYVVAASHADAEALPAERSASGAAPSFATADILFDDPNTGQWTVYFDGDSPTVGLAPDASIDAFQIEEDSDPPTLLLSFAAPADVPGVGTVAPGDVVRFIPDGASATGTLESGTFAVYKRAADLGLPGDANIDGLDRAPDGRLLLSTGAAGALGDVNYSAGDLLAFDEASGALAVYFDSSEQAGNLFEGGVAAAWLEANGDINVLAAPQIGGSALTFIEASDSIARGNVIYNNYGEGLVAGRNSVRITLENNISYDNQHANIYLNSVQYPVVRRNLVYCTDDRRFWGNRNGVGRPSPGIMVRDEYFHNMSKQPERSTDQLIVNNIVVGCGMNFAVNTQSSPAGEPAGGLINAVIANNTFVGARGDHGAPINNVEFQSAALYRNSRFVNNLIWQPTGVGRIVNIEGGSPSSAAFAGLALANNVYSYDPGNNWFKESGRHVGDPGLHSPEIPRVGKVVDPAWFTLKSGAAAANMGQRLPQVTDDFWGRLRDDGKPDAGAHEYRP